MKKVLFFFILLGYRALLSDCTAKVMLFFDITMENDKKK
jgi:hypothetical protein